MADNNSPTTENKGVSIINEIFQWILAVIVAIVIALAIRGFIFEPVKVIGESMQNTLFTGQRLIAYKLGYFFSPPKKGDIVVLEYKQGLIKFLPLPDPSEIDYIKRVIGTPGDNVDLKDGYVYLNGKKLDEPYAKGLTYKMSLQFPVTVPAHQLLVMGDNRQNSSDSRQIGFIDYSRIKGRAIFRMWPLKDFGSVH